MASREKLSTNKTGHVWTPEEEIQLFYALWGLKPVGVNRHFYMACIVERLSKSLNRDFTAEQVWAHLRTIYNLDAIELQETLPFPNDEKEFSLPETEFSALLAKKRSTSEESPPSIIAVITDNTTKVAKSTGQYQAVKDTDKKVSVKLADIPKRSAKRTRGSVSHESNSPSTTPPPIQNSKRRRI